MQCAVYIQHDLSIKKKQTEKYKKNVYTKKKHRPRTIYLTKIQLRTLLFV